MILPSKHSRLQDSVLHGGSTILRSLGQPTTVSVLWERVSTRFGSFHSFCLSLDFLHCVGLIDFDEAGTLLVKTMPEAAT